MPSTRLREYQIINNKNKNQEHCMFMNLFLDENKNTFSFKSKQKDLCCV